MAPTTSQLLIFFFNDTATTEIYTLSLHDALPISVAPPARKLGSIDLSAFVLEFGDVGRGEIAGGDLGREPFDQYAGAPQVLELLPGHLRNGDRAVAKYLERPLTRQTPYRLAHRNRTRTEILRETANGDALPGHE